MKDDQIEKLNLRHCHQSVRARIGRLDCSHRYSSFAATARRIYLLNTNQSLAEPERTMTISLKPLPFPLGALEPHISATTVQLHHEHHEAGYVERVNRLVSGTELENHSLEEVVIAARQLDNPTLFNMAAQAWNHSFYWSSLDPRGGALPHGGIATLIDKDFGSYSAFAEQLREAATTKFGSGWAWLVLESGRLEVTVTSNADLPPEEQIPLLVIDVWEHAYYLDYQYRRAAYVTAIIEHFLNWEFANARLLLVEQGNPARKSGEPWAIVLSRGVI